MDMPFKEFGDKIKIKIADLDEIVKQIRKERKAMDLTNFIQLIPSRGHKNFDPSYKPPFTKDYVASIINVIFIFSWFIMYFDKIIYGALLNRCY